MNLHEISYIENLSQLEFCKQYQSSTIEIINNSKRSFGPFAALIANPILSIGDKFVAKWLEKTNNPYKEEIAEYHKIINTKGVYALNMSYEWGCSSGGFKVNNAATLFRILDWPFKGLGEHSFVVKTNTPIGDYYNITWPGVTGVFQAMAPNRFAAAINQAPMQRHNFTLIGDWIKNRHSTFKSHAIPPAHLLRHVFEVAPDYETAKKLLSETPICLPVIYTLTGVTDQQACVIERLENQFRIREIENNDRVTATNHFQTDIGEHACGWTPRAIDSKARCQIINNVTKESILNLKFAKLNYPLLSHLTRIILIACAKTGTLQVQGFEKTGAATQIFELQN